MDPIKLIDYVPDKTIEHPFVDLEEQINAFRELLVLSCRYRAYLPYLRDAFVPDTSHPFGGNSYLSCFYGQLYGLEESIELPLSAYSLRGLELARQYYSYLSPAEQLANTSLRELYPSAALGVTPLESIGLELTEPEYSAYGATLRSTVRSWFDQIEAILAPLWVEAGPDGIPVDTSNAFIYAEEN